MTHGTIEYGKRVLYVSFHEDIPAMAHLTYESGETYRKANTSLTTTFDLNDLFTWATAHNGTPKRDDINVKLASLMGVKAPAYSKCSELTESSEFHTACIENGNANVMALPKNGRKDTPERKGKRGSNGTLTNSDLQEIGKRVSEYIGSYAKETESPSENGTERITTKAWVITNFEYAMALAITCEGFNMTERPARDISVNAKLETANDRIKNGVIKLHTERNMDASTIAAVLDMTESEVQSILDASESN